MRFSMESAVSVGSSRLRSVFLDSTRLVSSPSPPPLSFVPTLVMKSSSVRLTLCITDWRALMRASSASSMLMRIAARSSCSAAMRLCAPRNAR